MAKTNELDDLFDADEKPSYDIPQGTYAGMVVNIRQFEDPKQKFPCLAVDFKVKGDGKKTFTTKIDAKFGLPGYLTSKKMLVTELLSAKIGARVAPSELSEHKAEVGLILAGDFEPFEIEVTGTKSAKGYKGANFTAV